MNSSDRQCGHPRTHCRLNAARACALVALLFVMTAWTTVAAADQETSSNPTAWAMTALGFGSGLLAAYSIHEGAHWAAAGLTDTDLEWESGTYNQPLGFTEDADSDTNGAVLHGAGLVGQALSGEVILALDSIDKTHPFVRGMMFWNVANPIIYAFDYWFLNSSNRIDDDGYQGDLAGIEHYAGKDTANTFAAATTILALWQGYRFLKAQDQTPAEMSTVQQQGPQISLAPSPKGGAMFCLKIPF